MDNSLIKLVGVNKEFPGVKALDDIHFEIEKNTVHCIVGENGAGKSTLMKILSGAYTLDSGEIIMDGQDVTIKNPADAIRLGIGIVYQELSNFPNLTVAHNLFANNIPRSKGLIDYNTLNKRAREVLNSAGLSYIDETATMKDISLGSQQMVEVARLLSLDIKVMILDEPTSALTDVEVNKLYDFIDELKQKGITIIYISHKLDEILHLADNITVLKDGKHVNTFKKTEDTTRDTLVKLMVGRDVAYDYQVGTSTIGEEILRVENITSGTMVKNANFSLHKGEILGIAGLEGSGRTELLESIFGWRSISEGELFIRNEKVHKNSPMVAKRNKLAYITKDRKSTGLFLELDVKKNIAAAYTNKFKKNGLLDDKQMANNAEKYVEAMDIKVAGLSQMTVNLSGGNQQKVLLSMWLTTDPDIILIDEPTRGIDVGAKAEIHSLLRNLTKEGKAIIIVSSEMPEILASCDRILVMYEGQITGELSNKEATEEAIMKLASGLN